MPPTTSVTPSFAQTPGPASGGNEIYSGDCFHTFCQHCKSGHQSNRTSGPTGCLTVNGHTRNHRSQNSVTRVRKQLLSSPEWKLPLDDISPSSQRPLAADTSYSSRCLQRSRGHRSRMCPLTPSALPLQPRAHTLASPAEAGIRGVPGHSSPRNQDRSGLSFQVNPVAGAEGGRSPARKRPPFSCSSGGVENGL